MASWLGEEGIACNYFSVAVFLPSVVAGSVDGGFEGGQEGSDLLPREQVCNAQLKEIA